MGFLDLTIVSMFTITALSNSAYALVAPLLPFMISNRNIPQSLVGYIFAIYSVAVIFCSPLVGKMILLLGRRRLIQIGTLIMGLAFISFSLIDLFDNNNLFISAVFTVRFIQGFSSSCI